MNEPVVSLKEAWEGLSPRAKWPVGGAIIFTALAFMSGDVPFSMRSLIGFPILGMLIGVVLRTIVRIIF